MPEAILTNVVVCEGGLNNQVNPLTIQPGEAIISINYEPSLLGGYRRITGFTKFDTTAVTGSGDRVLGVSVFDGGVLAVRDSGTSADIFTSTGSGWTKINGTTVRTEGGKHFFTKFDYTGTRKLIGVDGNNDPFLWDGTTFSELTSGPVDAKYVAEYKRHIFYSGYTTNTGAITFSVPLDETDFSAANGAGEIVVGDTVVALKKFRDQLIIFCDNSIFKLTGSSKFDFQLLPVTFDIGCAAADSVQEIGGDLYFLAPDGIRTLAGTERIGDIELASVSKKIQDLTPNVLSTSNTNITSLNIPAKSQYRLFYSNDGDVVTDALGIVGGIKTASDGNLQWEWGELQGIKLFCADTDFITNQERIMHGAFDGFIYEQELGNDFSGTAVDSVLQTAYNHYDEPTKRKTNYKATIFYQAEGVISLDVFLIYDYDDGDKLQPANFTITTGGSTTTYGAAVYNTDAYGSAEIPKKAQTTIGSGFQTSLKFLANDSNPPHIIQGFTLEYGLGGRR